MLPTDAALAVAETQAAGGNVVVITGAGVSIASGLRAYRGAGGRWTEVGSGAMVKATASYFHRDPEESWAWHLARRSEVLAAEPNVAHHAIADLEAAFSTRFTLITQNIDRFHLRAGNTPDRVIELHGYLDGMRCTGECDGVMPVPDGLHSWGPDDAIEDDHLEVLVCPVCGLATRPHVLWFDEFYDEEHYRIDTAQRAVANASLCITVGTSGGVPVAERLAGIAVEAGATHIDVNPHDNELRQFALHSGGVAVMESASAAMPLIAEIAHAVRAHGEAGKG